MFSALIGVPILLTTIFVDDPRPLRQFCSEAEAVLYGKMGQSVPQGGFNPNEGYTEFRVFEVIKSPDSWQVPGMIRVPRYVPGDHDKGYCVVFVNLYRGRFDVWATVSVEATETVMFFRELVKLKSSSSEDVFRFFFRHVRNPSRDVARAACHELNSANYLVLRSVAQDLTPDLIASWLQDSKIETLHVDLYAKLLGHCGTAKHATLLRTQLEESLQDKRGLLIEPLLTGYILLDPEAGWKFAQTLLDKQRLFMQRYGVLRTGRFFWEHRSDCVSRDQLAEGACLLLDQADIADLAIDELRRWKRWDKTERILALYDRKDYEMFVRRAIIRFALASPRVEVTKPFLTRMLQADTNIVNDAAEALELEAQQKAKSKP